MKPEHVRHNFRCPVCGGGTKVCDSRIRPGNVCRRRRRCLECDHRFSTREIVESADSNLPETERLLMLDRRKIASLKATLATLLEQLATIESYDLPEPEGEPHDSIP